MSHIIKSLGSITWSDIIEIAGIIASTITSIIAIAISVKTLRQNNKTVSYTHLIVVIEIKTIWICIYAE